MKTLSAFSAALAFVALAGCAQSIKTDDVTKTQKFILSNTHNSHTVASLKISIRGHIDGSADVVLILNAEPYKKEILTGDFDINWRSDWYSNNAEIRYSPKTVTSGKMKISYEFED